MSPDDDINPYQAPQVDAYRFSEKSDLPVEQWRRKVKRFRQQMHGLGALWAFAGLPNGLFTLAYVFEHADVSSELIPVYWGAGAFLLSLLVATATTAKHLGGVVTGCALSVIPCAACLVGALAINLNWAWFLAIFAPIMLGGCWQGCRLLRWASEMRAAGIPLDARPEDVVELFRTLEFTRVQRADR